MPALAFYEGTHLEHRVRRLLAGATTASRDPAHIVGFRHRPEVVAEREYDGAHNPTRPRHREVAHELVKRLGGFAQRVIQRPARVRQLGLALRAFEVVLGDARGDVELREHVAQARRQALHRGARMFGIEPYSVVTRNRYIAWKTEDVVHPARPE